MNKIVMHCFSILFSLIFPFSIILGFVPPMMPSIIGGSFLEGMDSNEISLEEYEICIEENTAFLPPLSCLESDSLELVAFYNATGGDNWTHNSGWLTAPVSEWYGISLSPNGCHIDTIFLNNNNLTGNLIDLDLPLLKVLELIDNNLTGSIPNFQKLPSLITLYLKNNQLTGSIPNFQGLPQLVNLVLPFNQLSGTIPNFNNMPFLHTIYLYNNELTGTIPNLSSSNDLKYIHLYNNQLTGSIPEFKLFTGLISLNFSNNHLTGTIPSLNNSLDLQTLNVANNQLTNTLPKVSNFSDLGALICQNNQLTFDGLEANVNYFNTSANFHTLVYAPQTTIPLLQSENTLYVEVGGDLADNHYAWYKDGVEYITFTGDNSLTVNESGTYYVEVTNDVVTNPNINEQNLILVSEKLFITTNTCSPESDGTIWVTTTEDNGDNDNPTAESLRAAIICANETTGANTIKFNLTGTAPFVFQPTVVYPTLANSKTIIDGTTQTNWSLGDIEIDGSDIITVGFSLQGNQCEIHGLYIHSFLDNGIYIRSGSCLVENNIVSDNSNNGVKLLGADLCLIYDNVFSNNLNNGIDIDESDFCTVENNKIGTNLDGTVGMPNKNGILIQRSRSSTIQNNLISSNLESGIYIFLGSGYIKVENNTIGTAIDGITAMPNGAYGIRFNFGYNIDIGNNLGTGANIIAHNPIGIQVETSSSHCQIYQNSIFCNTDKGISTSLYSPPNINNFNFNIISGTSVANDTIEVFLHDETGCLGVPCQGKTYLGTAYTDSNGDWSLDSFTETIEVGQQVVATATNVNTSEFSTCKSICPEYEINILGETVFCEGSSTILSTDDLAFTNYEWSNGSSNSSIDVMEGGVFTVTVTDGNECSATTSTEVNMIPIPSAYWGEDIVDCNCLTADSLELVIFYYAMGGDNWTNNSGWLIEPMSEWFGVTLSEDGCSVKELDMVTDTDSQNLPIGNNLTGMISDLNLPNLKVLNLPSNLITGEIPNFTHLNNLTELDLRWNELSGEIPNFNNLPQLTELDLSYNQLLGEIPNFNNLSQLTSLSLSNNQLTGEIPNFDLPLLTKLYLYSNQLTGEIPNFNFPKLKRLSLGSNELTGEIPNFNNLPQLTGLHLRLNKLSGEIPNFTGLSKLGVLSLHSNKLSGEIPNFTDLPQLRHLYSGDNELSGEIPNFTDLPQLTALYLYSNKLSGEIPDFTNLPKLNHLSLQHNELSGTIPNFTDLPQLTLLYLHSNQFTFAHILNSWEFTANVGGCDSIFDPCLRYASQATIPLSPLQPNNTLYVEAGDVSNNHYTWYKDGVIMPDMPISGDSILTIIESGTYYVEVRNDTITNPNEYWQNLVLVSEEKFIEIAPLNCSELITDSLALVNLYNQTGGSNWANTTSNNQKWLEGPVSTWHGVSLTEDGCNVQRLELPNNNLSGTLPELELTQLKRLDLQDNQLTGEIPNFSHLESLEFLELSNNQFTYFIPNFIDLFTLQYLNLGSNQLTGFVPNFASLPDLQQLYLNDNQLFGKIPDFKHLVSLEELNLAGNQLEGSIPNFSALPNLRELYLEENLLKGHLPNFSELPNLQSIQFQHNKFVFADILPAWEVISNLEACAQEQGSFDFCALYAPQDTLLSLQHISDTLYVTATDHLHNRYTWYKDGVRIHSEPIYQDSTLLLTQTGKYYVEISNDIISNPASTSQNLILRSEELDIDVLSDPSKCEGAISLNPITPKQYGLYTHFGFPHYPNGNQENLPACFTDNAIDNNTWFTFTGDGSTYTISVANCDNPLPLVKAQMAIFEGPNCENLSLLRCAEGTVSTSQTSITLPTVANRRYYLLVDSYAHSNGTFCIDVKRTSCILMIDGSIPVTTLEDHGNDYNPTPGSLRAAIICANKNEGPNRIYFDTNQIEDFSHPIQPEIPLPTLIDANTTIDGSYILNNIESHIELDGSLLNTSTDSLANGFRLQGANSKIQGFFIHSFSNHGIAVDSCQGCIIGDLENSKKGNIISGNTNTGIFVNSESTAVGIHHNKIGTHIIGENAFPNGTNGIQIKGATEVSITSNLLSGNTENGIFLDKTGEVFIEGNRIGTNAAGTQALSNERQGIYVIEGTETRIANNLVSGNKLNGIRLYYVEEAWIQNNFIGTDNTGTVALGNGFSGIWSSGETQFIDIRQNVLADNIEGGIKLEDTETIYIIDNQIGTNKAGNQALGNHSHGIEITGVLTNNNYLHNNIVAANAENGIFIKHSINSIIENNFIGTDSTGNLAIPNTESGIFIRRSENTSLIHNTILHQETGVLISGITQAPSFNTHLSENTIAHNETGIEVKGISNNYTFKNNSLYCNTALGINIESTNSVTLPPIILEATTNSTIGKAEAMDSIEVFIHDDTDCGGVPCQGKTLVGKTRADDNGNWTLEEYIEPVTEQQLVATATRFDGNTSEFSDCLQVIECLSANWETETGQFEICASELPFKLLPESEEGIWGCTGDCETPNMSCIEEGDNGEWYFAYEFNNSDKAVDTVSLSYITNCGTSTNCTTHEIIVYRQAPTPSITFPFSSVCDTTQEVLIQVQATGGFDASNSYFEVYDENDNLLTSAINSNGATVDLKDFLTPNSTNTFGVRTINGLCESETMEISFFVEECELYCAAIIEEEWNCESNSYTLTVIPEVGNPLVANYQWSNESQTQSIETTIIGAYTVTVTDENNCQATTTAELTTTSFPLPTIGGNLMLCEQGSSTALHTGDFANYLWSNGASTQSIEVSEIGAYGVTTTDFNGCMHNAVDTVGVYELSILVDNEEVTNDTLIINTGEVVDFVAVVEGSENVNYSWTPTEGLSFPFIPQVTASPDTSTTYTIEVLIDGNCVLTANVTVLVLPTAYDCTDAVWVCDNSPIEYNSSGIGTQELINDPVLESGEHYSTWIRFKIDETSPPNERLTFTIQPNDDERDYDFALYKSADCSNLGIPVRGSYASSSNPPFSIQTGLSLEDTDVPYDIDNNGFAQYIEVNPEETYYLLVDNFSGNFQGFTLEWTNPNIVFDCSEDCPPEVSFNLNAIYYLDDSIILDDLLYPNVDDTGIWRVSPPIGNSGIADGGLYEFEHLGIYTFEYTLNGTTCSQITIVEQVPITHEDCIDAFKVCVNTPIYLKSEGNGSNIELPEGDEAIRGCLKIGELQSTWLEIQVGGNEIDTSLLVFTIVPEHSSENFDFAIYQADNCNGLGEPIRCSASSKTGSTGLSRSASDSSESFEGDSFVAPLEVVAGNRFFILVNYIEFDNNHGFTLHWEDELGDSPALLSCEQDSFQCPVYEFNKPAVTCEKIYWNIEPIMHLDGEILTIDIVQNTMGWSYQYKIGGIDEEWKAISETAYLEPNTAYTVFIRVVEPNTNTPIFPDQEAEQCFSTITTPPLGTFGVNIEEQCFPDGSVELQAIVEGSDASDYTYTFLWSNGKTTQIINESAPFDEINWVEVTREDDCVGRDSISHVGPPDIDIEYTDLSLCMAIISIENTIPQSITCNEEEVPNKDCWWNEEGNIYSCEITLLEPSDKLAEVMVIDEKGCKDSIALFTCLPHISRVRPNPSPSLFVVELEGIPLNTPLAYKVYSSDGRLVLKSDDLGSNGSDSENWRSIEIELGNGLLSGLYIVRFQIGKNNPFYLSTKLIKKAND